jgi:hypothetical protein
MYVLTMLKNHYFFLFIGFKELEYALDRGAYNIYYIYVYSTYRCDLGGSTRVR